MGNYKGTSTGEMLDKVLFGSYDSGIGKVKFKLSDDEQQRTFAISAEVVAAPAAVTYSIGSANDSGQKTVTLACVTSGVTIRYNVTSDGSTPADPTATSGTVYTSSGITLTPSTSATTTTHKIKAVAVKNGEISETITTIETTTARRVAKPTISITASGASVSAAIACGTTGAVIAYTTDGTTPAAPEWDDEEEVWTTENGTIYVGAIAITSATANIKAVAVLDGWATSATASATQDIFRYGFAGETIDADGVAALTAKKGAPAGTYTLTKSDGSQYTWFACKTGASISRVTMNTFQVNLEAADTTTVQGWKLYRSSGDAALAGSYTYVVEQ
ncbi:MAG: chitobiase/beta-hexosaminidase C-terminal domain-containing protein [Bacteroidales bacterium]|nr:chitobiase/beta-hexosaminidase C-terminal domain-containing protein [Bacteroidales bacterium]